MSILPLRLVVLCGYGVTCVLIFIVANALNCRGSKPSRRDGWSKSTVLTVLPCFKWNVVRSPDSSGVLAYLSPVSFVHVVVAFVAHLVLCWVFVTFVWLPSAEEPFL